MQQLFRYRFEDPVSAGDVEASLVLAILTAETVHSADELREAGAHAFDPETRTLVISATQPAAMTLNQIFGRLMEREFGAEAFDVQVVDATVDPIADH